MLATFQTNKTKNKLNNNHTKILSRQIPKQQTVEDAIIVQGPDLAPLVNKMKEEYPIVSKTNKYKEIFKKTNPLVSVIITTYNDSNSLINIALKSVLNQTYKNLEILVTAEHSTDNTDQEMLKIKDSRINYENLSVRPIYPSDKRQKWLVAGSVAQNNSLSKATGDFITYCDHDDYFTLDRIEKLVKFIQEQQCDFVYHPFYDNGLPGKTTVLNNATDLILAQVTTSSVFYHSWFKQIPNDVNSWKVNEPGDWNKFKKFKEIGAKVYRHPEFLTYKG